jgi:major histocompatibility complex class I
MELRLSEPQNEGGYKTSIQPGVVAHAFNPSTWEAEAGGFLSLRPAWSTE